MEVILTSKQPADELASMNMKIEDPFKSMINSALIDGNNVDLTSVFPDLDIS